MLGGGLLEQYGPKAGGGGQSLLALYGPKPAALPPPDTSGFDITPEEPGINRSGLFRSSVKPPEEPAGPSGLQEFGPSLLRGAGSTAAGLAEYVGGTAAHVKNLLFPGDLTEVGKRKAEERAAEPGRRVRETIEGNIAAPTTFGGRVGEGLGGAAVPMLAGPAAPAVLAAMGGQQLQGVEKQALASGATPEEASLAMFENIPAQAAQAAPMLGFLRSLEGVAPSIASRITTAVKGAAAGVIGNATARAIGQTVRNDINGEQKSALEAAAQGLPEDSAVWGILEGMGLAVHPGVGREEGAKTREESAKLPVVEKPPPAVAEGGAAEGGPGGSQPAPGQGSLPQEGPGGGNEPTQIDLGDRRAVERAGAVERRTDVAKRQRLADIDNQADLEALRKLHDEDAPGALAVLQEANRAKSEELKKGKFTLPGERAFSEADRVGKVETSADIDGLKAANDTYGHNKGDELLQQTNDIVEQEAAKTPGVQAFHTGGDEIRLLSNSREDAEAVMQRVQERLKGVTVEGTETAKGPNPGAQSKIQGFGISYGHGEPGSGITYEGGERARDFVSKEAEDAMYANKEARTASGERVDSRVSKTPKGYSLAEEAQPAPPESAGKGEAEHVISGPRPAPDLVTDPEEAKRAKTFSVTKGGKSQGYMLVDDAPEGVTIKNVQIAPESRRQGLSKQLTLKAAEMAEHGDRPLLSGMVTSPERESFWKDLESRGIAEKIDSRHWRVVAERLPDLKDSLSGKSAFEPTVDISKRIDEQPASVRASLEKIHPGIKGDLTAEDAIRLMLEAADSPEELKEQLRKAGLVQFTYRGAGAAGTGVQRYGPIEDAVDSIAHNAAPKKPASPALPLFKKPPGAVPELSQKAESSEQRGVAIPRAEEAARQAGETQLARWGDGLLVQDRNGKIKFRHEERADAPEDWPTPGKPGPEKLERLASDLMGRADVQTFPALEPYVRKVTERLAAEEAARRERAETEAKARKEYAAETAKVQEKFIGAGKGWKRGSFRIDQGNGETKTSDSGYVSPSGALGIHRPEGAKDWTLTHVGSGKRISTGSQADLKVLAARLEAVEGIDWKKTKLTNDELKRALPVVQAFQSGGPFTPIAKTEQAEGLPTRFLKKPPESKQAGALNLFGGKKNPQPAAPSGAFDVPEETKRDKFYSAVVNDFQRIVNLEKAAPNKPSGMSLEHALSAFPGRRFGEAEKLQKQAVEPLKEHLAANNIPPIESPKLGKPSASDYLYALHAQDMAAKGGAETGISTKDAQAILARAGPEYTKIRDWNRALNEKRLDVLEGSGLISSEQRAAWEAKYGEDYVPLRTAKDPMAQLFGTSKGLAVSGKESKAREGRSSKADSPLAFAVETMQTAIDRAESNKIGQKIGELVTKNPEPSLWRIESDANKIKEGEQRLAFKENGEQRYIVTKDKGLSDAFKRITNPDPGVLKLVDPILRAWHKVIIQYNPVFSLKNVQRDVGETLIKHAIRGDLGAALSQLRGETPAIKGAFEAIRKEGAGGKWGDVYRDARDNGALIGWREQFSYEDRIKDFEKAFTKTGKVKAFLGLIDDLNRSAELGTRLSAYKSFLDGGMSKPEAAMESRRITADFARRGSLAPIYRRLYLFSGANVQGIAEAARSIKNNPGKASVVVGSMIGAGLLNYQLSKTYGDDHELDKLSEYDKARHFGVMIGKRKYGFTAPYTFSVFPYIGWKLGELLHGDTTKADALSNIAQQAIDAASPLPQGANLVQSLTPSLARPAMELVQNESFSGAPIYPQQDQFAKVPKPASKLFFRNVSGASKEITEGLHRATGGTEVKPGAVEISPEVLDHLAAAMSGGVGTFAKGTWDVVRKMVTGQADQIRATDIPGARAFIAEPSRGSEGQLFKKNVGEVEMSKAQKKAREEPDKPEALRLGSSASDAEKQIRALYKKMDLEGMSEQDKNEIQQRIDEIRERFNRRAKPVLRGQ